VANFAEGQEHIIKQKYKLVNFGKGGAFGDVFFAKHTEKGYDVAIKFVSIL
jgi:serine/threonine protein kinase